MRCRLRLLIALVALLAPPAVAYHIDNHLPVVIDTDMGLDDAVTLATALQSPGTVARPASACVGPPRLAAGQPAADVILRRRPGMAWSRMPAS